jgi:SAM-dependent methyltransferase
LLSDGNFDFPVLNNNPVLYPSAVNQAFLNSGLDLKYYEDSVRQYFLLSQIKQRGEINAPSESIHYQRHLYRMKQFLMEYEGLALDVGCDNTDIGASLFSSKCKYLGLDPFASDNTKFKVIGVGETLPFKSEIFDVVLFNTSLDHILDYNTAIEEAYRVLKSGGVLVISILIWHKNATLLRDMVHFHHFRDFEIVGALSQKGTIIKQKEYPYKGDENRYGLYIAAKKV